MNSSMFATIFIVVLAVIFIFLVVMTIVMIATAGKKKTPKQKHDIHDDEKKTKDLHRESEDSIFADAKMEADATAIENGKIDEDSAFAKNSGKPTAYEEAAATGSAFAENIGMDSAFAENVIDDDTYVNNIEEDDIFDDNRESQTKAIPLVGAEPNVPIKETIMTQAMVEATERTESELKNAIEEFLSEAEPEAEIGTLATATTEAEVEPEVARTTEVEPEAEAESEAAVTAETGIETEPISGAEESDVTVDAAAENHADEINLDEIGTDSAFGPEVAAGTLSDEEITASIREALNAVRAVGSFGDDTDTMFGMSEELAKYGSKKKVHKKSTVASNEDFYWYNLLDVSEKPSYKTAEMYYHYFTIASDCIDDLLMEMYDCALVRTEEIRYIAYGIPPKAVSMRDILTSGNSHYMQHEKQKEPTTQDLVRIYEKWCSYVDNLFEKIEIHADEFTINEIRTRLYEFGRNDVEVILEGR